MTTYESYEAAKISNPESVVFGSVCNGFFTTKEWIDKNNNGRFLFVKSNPADYCMTVEKFLADGYKFVEGDVVSNLNGGVSTVNYSSRLKSNDDYCLEYMNYPEDGDEKRYILRAAALEDKTEGDFWAELESSINEEKPRIKVEYEKVGFHKCHEAMFEHEMEGVLYGLICNEFKKATLTYISNNWKSDLYRRIETPMTWKEELYNYLDNSCEMSDDFDDSFTIEIEGKPLEFNLNDDEFVDMCKLVASLNSVN